MRALIMEPDKPKSKFKTVIGVFFLFFIIGLIRSDTKFLSSFWNGFLEGMSNNQYALISISVGVIVLLIHIFQQRGRDKALPPSGIGGWLSFFIFSYAITGVFGIFDTWQTLPELKKQFQGFETAVNILILYLLLFAFLELYFLYLLFKKHSDAVRFIKVWLIFSIFFTATTPVVGYLIFNFELGNIFPIPNDVIAEIFSRELMQSIANCVVWFWYFSVSIRVKNTWENTRLFKPRS